MKAGCKRRLIFLISVFLIITAVAVPVSAAEDPLVDYDAGYTLPREKTAGETEPEGIETRETWWVSPEFDRLAPERIAVLPMDNLSLEPDVEKALYTEVYARLTGKGYIRISVDAVRSEMKALGIQTAGQLSGISPERLGKILKCDAVLTGRVDQSGTIHMGVYDALVVSCSLKLVHCKTGKDLWLTEQWRAAHRQWNADPINLLLNLAAHESASRADRAAWLAREMLKTLPDGPVQVSPDNLLDRAVPIKTDN